MYATHCHDLFYITVKYHQTIPNGIDTNMFTDGGMDGQGRTPGSLLYPPILSVGD